MEVESDGRSCFPRGTLRVRKHARDRPGETGVRFSPLDGRGGTGVCFEAGGRMINASEPADMQQMRDAFVRSFLVSCRVYTRAPFVNALKDPPTATEL